MSAHRGGGEFASPPSWWKIVPADRAGAREARDGMSVLARTIATPECRACPLKVVTSGLILVLGAVSVGVQAQGLGLNELVPIDFGAVLDQNGTIRLGLDDSIISDPNGIHLGGLAQTGHCQLTGIPDMLVSLSIQPYKGRGLFIKEFYTQLGTQPTILVRLGQDGTFDLDIGASLRVKAPQVQVGADQPLYYVISAIYE